MTLLEADPAPILEYGRVASHCPPGRRRAVRIMAGVFAVGFLALVVAVAVQSQAFGTLREIIPVLAVAAVGFIYCGLVAAGVLHR